MIINSFGPLPSGDPSIKARNDLRSVFAESVESLLRLLVIQFDRQSAAKPPLFLFQKPEDVPKCSRGAFACGPAGFLW